MRRPIATSPRAYVSGVALALALLLAVVSGALAADEVRGFVVEYHPPLLTVEADGAPLAVVLREIGARVGFRVVDDAKDPVATASLSMKDMPVDVVLQSLLRGQNHAVVYSTQTSASSEPGAAIAEIVLLGEPQPAPQGLVVTAPNATGSPTPARLPAGLPLGLNAQVNGGSGVLGQMAADSEPITVQSLLTNAAMAARPPATASANDQAQAASAPILDQAAALAVATRRAQESLAALVNALTAVSASLPPSPAPK